MITDDALPDDWRAAGTSSTYDETMDHEFESRRFEHAEREATVDVNEVVEPEDFEDWGYQVVATPETGPSTELGMHVDLDDAREAAIEYMTDHP